MSSSGAVDAALFAALGADATLKTLCPDGVWRNQAPQGRTRFVMVALSAHDDRPMFHGTAFERFVYAVSAVLKDQSSVNAAAAEDRIKAVLEAVTSPAGYDLAIAQRGERIAYSEPDPVNPDLFWQHFGGLFEVLVTPA
jgi:hypothetical protein